MGIDAKTVAALRKMTGLPMMKCKKALEEANGDLDLAADNLRKGGVKQLEKLAGADRGFNDGLVFVHQDGDNACAVSLLCQTDFVAKSEDAIAFGEKLVKDLYDNAPSDEGTGEDLADYTLADGTSLKSQWEEFALKMGEQFTVGAFARFKPENGSVVVYKHHNNRIAAVVELEGENLAGHDAVMALGNDIGMQISFHKDVQALDESGVDADWIAKEREIFKAQVAEMPADKQDMIAEGKLKKRIKDVALLPMPFIKNDKVSVEEQVQAVAKEVGTSLSIKRFARIGAGA